jgi:hypothetical protein
VQIAYLTLDDVNQELIQGLAAGRGAMAVILDPRDLPVRDGSQAVFLDWDSWPHGQREETLRGLVTGGFPGPIAVHSYGISSRQVVALRQQGILVFRRLGPHAVCSLLRQVRGSGERGAAQPAPRHLRGSRSPRGEQPAVV